AMARGSGIPLRTFLEMETKFEKAFLKGVKKHASECRVRPTHHLVTYNCSTPTKRCVGRTRSLLVSGAMLIHKGKLQ
ncbi:MAG: hypothetical protein ABFS56_02625, partial [Pseudomonadota bacterium]